MLRITLEEARKISEPLVYNSESAENTAWMRIMVGCAPLAEWEGILFIQGPGIDEYLERAKRIIILDEFYLDMYSDYVFLGPEVYGETISMEYPDIVGVINTLITLRSGETLIVCGDDPRPCITLLAALLLQRTHQDPRDAVKKAWSILKTAYSSPDYTVRQELLSYPLTHLDMLKVFRILYNLLSEKLLLLASLALNYDYGLGRRAYSELVTWSLSLDEGNELLFASLFSFLALAPYGKPSEILKYRLSLLPIAELKTVFGDPVEPGIRILEEYAKGKEDAKTVLFKLLVSLKPGSGIVRHVRREEKLSIYCSREETDATLPSKKCIEIVNKTLSMLGDSLPPWAREPVVGVGTPEGVTLTPPR